MRTLFSLTLILFSFILFAQKISVNVSPEISFENEPPLKFGDAYFGIEAKAKSQSSYRIKVDKMKYRIQLQKFDKNLKPVKVIDLSNGDRVYGPFEPILKKIGDKLFLFYYQPFESSVKLISSEINTETLSLANSIELLSIQQKYSPADGEHMLAANKLILSYSPDSSKAVVLWYSDVNNQLFFSVVDKNFTNIRRSDEVITDADKIQLNNAIIDNEGNVFITGTYSIKSKFSGHLLISKPGAPLINRKVEISGGNSYDVFVTPDRLGANMQLIGTYNENSNNLSGVFIQQISAKDFQLGELKKTPFPQTLLKQLDDDRWAKEKGKNAGINNSIYFVPHVFEDGSVNLIGEFRQRNVSQGGHMYSVSGDILSIRFGKNNPVFTRIPKYRVNIVSEVGDSFFPYIYKNQMIIFYDDHEANLKQDISNFPKQSSEFKNSVLVAAVIDTDGNLRRDIITDMSSDNYLGLTSDIQIQSFSTLLIPFRKFKGLANRETSDLKWGLIKIN